MNFVYGMRLFFVYFKDLLDDTEKRKCIFIFRYSLLNIHLLSSIFASQSKM
jgi:hypothetical protein